jgi:hypothetical protein
MVLSFAVVLGFAVTASAAPPRGTKAIPSQKKHKGHTVKGVVVEVKHEKVSGHGEIKIKVHHKHHKKTAKSAAAAAAKKHKHNGIVTVHVNGATKFEKVYHHNGKVHRHKASFSEVHKGELVHAHLDGKNHHAREVDIIIHHHKKAPPKPLTKKPPVKKLPTKKN